MIDDALIETDTKRQATQYGEIQTYYADMMPSIQPFSEVVDSCRLHGRTSRAWRLIRPGRPDLSTVTKAR